MIGYIVFCICLVQNLVVLMYAKITRMLKLLIMIKFRKSLTQKEINPFYS